jgi:hypothetical protein
MHRDGQGGAREEERLTRTRRAQRGGSGEHGRGWIGLVRPSCPLANRRRLSNLTKDKNLIHFVNTRAHAKRPARDETASLLSMRPGLPLLGVDMGGQGAAVEHARSPLPGGARRGFDQHTREQGLSPTSTTLAGRGEIRYLEQ